MTVIGIQVGVLLGGAIIIETMFALPGVGRLIVTAINQRNYPVVQVGMLAIATIFIVVSLVTDLIVAWLDPRAADGERAMSDALAATAPAAGVAAPHGDPLMLLGGGVLAVLALVAIAAPSSRRTIPRRWRSCVSSAPPDWAHPFGSDVLGRDVLSRVIYGLRASLAVSVSAVLGSLAVAVPLGLLAGYFGRWVDSGISRVLDLILVFPAMLLAVTFIAVLGPGSVIAAIAIAVIYLPILARVMRTSTLIVSRNDYVAGARARGASHLRVMIGHVAPNAIGPVVVQASVLAAFALQLEAGLSFLGLGTQPPTPSLGGMLAEGREVLIQAPWVGDLPRPRDRRRRARLHLPRRRAAPNLRPAGGGRMSAVLELADVSVHFRTGEAVSGVPAVPSVSLALEPGEIFGIVGESGSGKSTVANAVMGLLPANASVSGSIRVDGREMIGLDDDALRQIRGDEVAMIFQDPSASLDPTWPVGDQIAETIRAHRSVSAGEAKARAIALMSEVGIKDAAARYNDVPHHFSGGQRQRIVIAAALANDPKLLIADEPTTALDVTIQAQVLQLIDRLRREHGTTVLLITHDLGVVSMVCDRVGVMYGGRLLETLTASALFTAASHPYTRALIASRAAGAPRGTRLPVIPPEWSVESLREAELLRDLAKEPSHG